MANNIQYDVYVPINNVDDYDSYYYNNDFTLIKAQKNDTCVIFDLKNHYNAYDVNCNDYLFDYEINKSNITTSSLYRTDIVDLCLLVVIFAFFLFYIPLLLFSRLFKKGRFL